MSLAVFLNQYRRDRRGSAAVEYTLWLAALSAPIFSAADIGYYGYEVLQAHLAAQMAAQSAFSACASTTNFPATSQCGANGANLNLAIWDGEHSTSLGPSAHMTSGSEQWLCETSTGLVHFDPNAGNTAGKEDGTIATKTTSGVVDVDKSGNSSPATFPAPGTFNCPSSTTEPGDYIVVNVTYAFKPLFKGFSVVNLLGGNNVTITQTAYTRLE
jgi:hypothetical protein